MVNCFQKLYAMYPDKKIDSIKELRNKDLRLYNDIRELSLKEHKTPSKLILDNGFLIKNARHKHVAYYYKRLNQEFNVSYKIIGQIFGISKQAVEQQVNRAKKYESEIKIIPCILDKTDEKVAIDMIQKNRTEQESKGNSYYIFTNANTENICLLIKGIELKCLFKEDLSKIMKYVHNYDYIKYKKNDIDIINILKKISKDKKIYIKDLDKKFIARIRNSLPEKYNNMAEFINYLGFNFYYSYNIDKRENIIDAFKKYIIFDKFVRVPKGCHLYNTIKLLCDKEKITFNECISSFGYEYLDDISFYKQKIEDYINENKSCLEGINLYLNPYSALYKVLYIYSNRHSLNLDDMIKKCGYNRVYVSDIEEALKKNELLYV